MVSCCEGLRVREREREREIELLKDQGKQGVEMYRSESIQSTRYAF